MDRGLFLDDAALRTPLIWARVAFDDIHTLDNHAVTIRIDLQHLSGFSPRVPGDHHNIIILLNVHTDTSLR